MLLAGSLEGYSVHGHRLSLKQERAAREADNRSLPSFQTNNMLQRNGPARLHDNDNDDDDDVDDGDNV